MTSAALLLITLVTYRGQLVWLAMVMERFTASASTYRRTGERKNCARSVPSPRACLYPQATERGREEQEARCPPGSTLSGTPGGGWDSPSITQHCWVETMGHLLPTPVEWPDERPADLQHQRRPGAGKKHRSSGRPQTPGISNVGDGTWLALQLCACEKTARQGHRSQVSAFALAARS